MSRLDNNFIIYNALVRALDDQQAWKKVVDFFKRTIDPDFEYVFFIIKYAS